MGYRHWLVLLLSAISLTITAQPKHKHFLKAIPLPLLNPLHQSIQGGYEYHYHPVRSLHAEAGYFHNELIYYDLFHEKKVQGIKLRAEHRFYTGGGTIADVWNDVYYLAPHFLFQQGWMNTESEFPRDGGNYFETLKVKGNVTIVGMGMTFGSWFDWTGNFVVEGSIQAGVKFIHTNHDLPDDILSDVFPPPWEMAVRDTWYLRPMINLTLALGWPVGNQKFTSKF